MSTPKRAAEYAETNRQTAAIVAADPAKYPGALQDWARLVLERAEPDDREAGPLFAGRAA